MQRVVAWLIYSEPLSAQARTLLEGESGCERLIDLCGELMQLISPCNVWRVRTLLKSYEAYEYLLLKLRRERGGQRARTLERLSSLPLGREMRSRIEQYLEDSSSAVRFNALRTVIAADRESACDFIYDFNDPLGPEQVELLVAMLMRVALPLTPTEMLRSSSENIQLIAIEMLRLGAQSDAIAPLREKAFITSSPHIRERALGALISLRLPLARVLF